MGTGWLDFIYFWKKRIAEMKELSVVLRIKM
jgi:hypothetical protein